MSGTLSPLPHILMACKEATLPLPKSDFRMKMLRITDNSRTAWRCLRMQNITYSDQHGLNNCMRKKKWDNQTAYSPPNWISMYPWGEGGGAPRVERDAWGKSEDINPADTLQATILCFLIVRAGYRLKCYGAGNCFLCSSRVLTNIVCCYTE
jgi:hypothetical protein